MHPVGFEPTISAGERPQTYALDWDRPSVLLEVLNQGGWDGVGMWHDLGGREIQGFWLRNVNVRNRLGVGGLHVNLC
jgi:hypothetical protein